MPALGPGPATFEEHTIMITRADQIRTALSALQPQHLEVIDESHLHSRGLETHYKAVIVSARFEGRRAIQRHQAVYAVLGDRMREEIHALSMKTLTPGEWSAAQQG